MTLKTFFVILALVCMIGIVSADSTSYYTQGSGVTAKGESGVMVPLGIPADMMYLYTWISLGFLFLIGGTASQRNGEFWAILLPIFAMMFVWFGWLVMPIAQGAGIIIMCGVLGTAVYFKGKQQEKFGIAGPGSPFLNIVFWMVLIQASIGFINAVGLFDATGGASANPMQYQNVDLTETIPDALSTGGFMDSITADMYLLGAATVSAFTMMVKVLMSIVYFKYLVISIAPFLASDATVGLLLDVISVGIDIIVLVAMWLWIFKPPLGEAI